MRRGTVGSHINEDHFFPEILDPDTAEPVPDGEEGVLVFTTLTKQALPLLRYWTGDITSLSDRECLCGRTLRRMALIKGRTDDMLIIRGVNLYPTEIELVLGDIAELSAHYRLVVTREGTLDELSVECEVTDDVFRTVGAECSMTMSLLRTSSSPRYALESSAASRGLSA